MSIFLTENEKKAVSLYDPASSNLYWGLQGQAARIAAAPGLNAAGADTEWWHHIFETVTSVACVVAMKAGPQAQQWLKSVAMNIAGCTEDEWIGPWYRNHSSQPPIGHLETAHVSMALAIALDLGDKIFTPEEKEHISAALRDKGIALCRNWLETIHYHANWRCVLLAGVTVPAAVLNDRPLLEECLAKYHSFVNAFQADGSYGESLQYAGYVAWALMMAHEALIRAMPELAGKLPMPYAGIARWAAYSLITNRPLSGWGDLPRPRSVNFNDSAAIFAPSPDLLLHIAVRGQESHPQEAALSRWLFDTLYSRNPNQGPFDRSSFGFVPRYGFLSLALLAQAPAPASPEGLDLPGFARFSSGPAIVRSGWREETVMAVSGVPDPLHCTGHLHADLNSIILAHDGEILLADPGHSCYHNLIHEIENSTRTHNTCVFFVPSAEKNGLEILLEQKTCLPGQSNDRQDFCSPILRPGRHLISAGVDDVTVFGNDVAAAYGAPVEEFTRFCIMTGKNTFFFIDLITTSAPARVRWNWLFNNRDGQGEYKVLPDRLVLRRGNSGMKMFHIAAQPTTGGGPVYGYLHDAYHPLPGKLGEGKPGSGLYFCWTEKEAYQGRRVNFHAVCADEYGRSSLWHMHAGGDTVALEGPRAEINWQVRSIVNGFIISETVGGRHYALKSENGTWSLKRQNQI